MRTPPGALPRLVASDLDGTLLREDGSVSARTAAALEQARRAGTVVVLVTARPPRWVTELAAALACHTTVICANGALIYDSRRGRIVSERALAPATAGTLVARLRRAVPDLAFAVEHADGFAHEPGYAPRWPAEVTTVAPIEELVRTPVAKLLARHGGALDDTTLLARCRAAAGALAEVSVSSLGGLVEVAAAGVTKGAALGTLAATLGLGPTDTIAFGDMVNDIPMLAWAGWGVAVANAHPALRQVADEITAAADDDGVARVLERLLPTRQRPGRAPLRPA